MNILISACLLGIPCKYSGGSNPCQGLLAAVAAGQHNFIPVCPEVYGGLPTPRPPAERQGALVIANAQPPRDVTAAFQRGAEAALALAQLTHCTAAILKANSPSCGYGQIYDGSFTGRKIPGDGVAAALLQRNGIPVYNEENYALLLSAPR
ncbi:MAG: DUF523 domain-containing protein [Gemmiger sp.]|nr:DUF523 domain-containing protein [Gemmiger sp.]